MGAKKKGAAKAPRPRSGYVREDQRKTQRLTARLPSIVADLLQHMSEKLDADKSALISLAVLRTFGHEFLEGADALKKLEHGINMGLHPAPEDD